MKREVGAQLDVDITAATTLEFQIAVAPHPRTEVSEWLSFVLDGRHIGRWKSPVCTATASTSSMSPSGYFQVDYTATVVGQTRPAPVTESDRSMYLRPSRYAEADKFYGFAATEFGDYVDSATLLERVSLWVGTRLNYVPGSRDPIDGAVDTLLAGDGVCRDFAHLVVALLRAVEGTRPRRLGLCAGSVSDGLPCGRRGIRRWAVAGSRRDVSGATAGVGAHRYRARCRRHRLPGQPRGCDHPEHVGGHGDRRRRSADRLCRPNGIDRLTGPLCRDSQIGFN